MTRSDSENAQHARWWDGDRHRDRRPLLVARNAIKAQIREGFTRQDFIEIEPGIVQRSPGNETHLHAFSTQAILPDGTATDLHLHTSPEFACKKLLAAGEDRLFTFTPTFRNRERGRLHAPEFTMLEWYRAGPRHPAREAAGSTYAMIQQDCADLIAIANAVTGPRTWRRGKRTCDATAAPLRLTVAGLIAELFAIDLDQSLSADGAPDNAALDRQMREKALTPPAEADWADLFSHLMAEAEHRYHELPQLLTAAGHERPLLLDHYPACMSPLARPLAARPRYAERFELFCCGIELANGFGESNDPTRVRKALEAEMGAREVRYGDRYPIDEDFIAALAEIPDATAGCALGFDRLVMLATGASSVEQVRWTPWPVPEH